MKASMGQIPPWGWDKDNITTAVINRYITDRSKGLTEATLSDLPTVQFIHESVNDYFLRENRLQEVWAEIDDNFCGFIYNMIKQSC
jgi:hypothetical protein